MSVQTEITRIQSAKRAISEAIGGKGVTVPPTAKLDDLAALAEAIPGPKPEQVKEITISENGDYPITPDLGKVLSKVLAKVNVSGGGGGGDFGPFSKIEYSTWTPADSGGWPIVTGDNIFAIAFMALDSVPQGGFGDNNVHSGLIVLDKSKAIEQSGAISGGFMAVGSFMNTATTLVAFDGTLTSEEGGKFVAGVRYQIVKFYGPLK